MEDYDVLVIGNGSGGYISVRASREGYKTALIDKPPIGGTCQNYGCMPSKMLINIADKLKQSRTLDNDGVKFEIQDIDFDYIMDELRKTRKKWQEKKREKFEALKNPEYYSTVGKFVDNYTIETEDGERLRGEKIFIANGARPSIPPIDGIDEVDYLTNETILELEQLPEKLIIIGGGYIGVEYAHFMSQVGSDVKLIQRGNRIVKTQDRDISEHLKQRLSKTIDLKLNTEAQKIEEYNNKIRVKTSANGEEEIFTSDEVMIATGRKPNSDILNLENTEIQTNERGYIKVNKYLETTQDKIWAVGDINGKSMFKHTANKESKIAWKNSKKESNKKSINYQAVPNAVFTEPKIGSVGLTEEEEAKENYEILVGKANYQDIEKGFLTNSKGMAKAIVKKDDKKILGFHIIGPDAPNLIQEPVNIISNNRTIDEIKNSIHTFPTLAELIPKTLKSLRTVN